MKKENWFKRNFPTLMGLRKQMNAWEYMVVLVFLMFAVIGWVLAFGYKPCV